MNIKILMFIACMAIAVVSAMPKYKESREKRNRKGRKQDRWNRMSAEDYWQYAHPQYPYNQRRQLTTKCPTTFVPLNPVIIAIVVPLSDSSEEAPVVSPVINPVFHQEEAPVVITKVEQSEFPGIDPFAFPPLDPIVVSTLAPVEFPVLNPVVNQEEAPIVVPTVEKLEFPALEPIPFSPFDPIIVPVLEEIMVSTIGPVLFPIENPVVFQEQSTVKESEVPTLEPITFAPLDQPITLAPLNQPIFTELNKAMSPIEKIDFSESEAVVLHPVDPIESLLINSVNIPIQIEEETIASQPTGIVIIPPPETILEPVPETNASPTKDFVISPTDKVSVQVEESVIISSGDAFIKPF